MRYFLGAPLDPPLPEDPGMILFLDLGTGLHGPFLVDGSTGKLVE
jgi:hypothetical protein